jgi:hypothetical protein
MHKKYFYHKTVKASPGAMMEGAVLNGEGGGIPSKILRNARSQS